MRSGKALLEYLEAQNFENFSMWSHCGFHVCSSLPKKNLDTSLVHSTQGTNDYIMLRGRQSLSNVFSSNLNTVTQKIFPDHSGIYTRR